MDKLDLLILNELTVDAQMPFSKIAVKLGVSTDTVIKRYHKMTAIDHMVKCSITFDPKRLGYKSMVFLFIRLEPNQNRREIAVFLAKLQSITTITSISGEFNIFADAVVRNLEEFTELMARVRAISGVEYVEFILSDDFSLYRRDFFSNVVRQALQNAEKQQNLT
jgi:Lrp/AsnC family transcriptional regulator for asnA, asnC and gidA